MAKPEDLPEGTEPKMSDDGQWVWHYTQWLPVPNAPDSTVKKAMSNSRGIIQGATNRQLLYGVQKGDTNEASTMRERAEISREQARRVQADEQKARQIAGRDFRTEADKDAASRAAAQFNQSMAQTSGAAGAGAAVLKAQNVQDPTATMQQHMARQDEQQQRAQQLATQAETAQELAAIKEGRAEDLNIMAANEAQHELAARSLATTEAEQGSEGNNTEEPVPESPEDVKEKDFNERITIALKPLTPESNPDLYQKGLEAIRAYYENPESLNSAAWLKFKREAQDAGATSISTDPGLSKYEGITRRYGPDSATGGTGSTGTSDARVKNIISAIHRKY